VTDGDGDTASDGLDISSAFKICDDEPTVVASGDPVDLKVDEVGLDEGPTASASASFAGLFTADYGADGEATTDGITYALGVTGPSGLVDTASGDAVVLSVVGGEIVGKAAGETVLTISVDGDGNVTFDQLRAVKHVEGDAVEDDEIGFAAGSVSLTATVTDGDGDTASDGLDISSAFKICDDEPTVELEKAKEGLVHDETPGLQGADTDYSALPSDIQLVFDDVANPGSDPHATPLDSNDAIGYAGGSALAGVLVTGTDAGADGEDSLTFELQVSASGVDSGVTTTSGDPILLYKELDAIVGRVGGAAGAAAFALAIDSMTGEIYLSQWLSVEHDAALGEDVLTSLDADVVEVLATLVDRDGDTATDTQAVGDLITFVDDDPVLGAIADTGAAPDTPLEFLASVDDAGKTFDWYAGSDGGSIAFVDWAVADATNTVGDQTFPSEWEEAFGAISASISGDGSVITFAGADAGDILAISLVDDSPTDGIASYEVDVLQDAPLGFSQVDLGGFPSGNPVETITLGTVSGETFVEFDGILWTGEFTGDNTNFGDLQTYISDFITNAENRPDSPSPTTFEKKDNLNRDTNGFGVFAEQSSLVNEFEGIITTFKTDDGPMAQTTSQKAIQFVLNQSGNVDDVIVTVIAFDSDGNSSIQSVEIDPLSSGGQASTDPFTIITSDLVDAFDYDGDGTFEGTGESGLIVLDNYMDDFETVYYLFSYPGGNDGLRIKEVNVLEGQNLPDLRLDLSVQGTDFDGDMTQTEDFSVFFSPNDDVFDFV